MNPLKVGVNGLQMLELTFYNKYYTTVIKGPNREMSGDFLKQVTYWTVYYLCTYSPL